MKKIATLNVYVAESAGEAPMSSSGTRPLKYDGGPKDEYVIVLNPEGDANSGLIVDTPQKLETVLAHELGHFSAMVAEEVSHEPVYKMQFGFSPSERKAWELAEVINPKIDREIRKLALDSYAFGDMRRHGRVR